ncbi:MAG TPA: response regulator [Gemmataceae bacterium]|nr:response regulator [Gemmataceae bacterium]
MRQEEIVPSAPQPATSPTALHVLLVEDDELVAFSLATLLRRSGHRVDVAHTGEAALEVASACRPHIALVDLGLPDMDGYEVAGRFRGQEALRGVLLVALTGWSDDESRRLGEEAGFAYYLDKPVDFAGLHGVLVRAAASSLPPR